MTEGIKKSQFSALQSIPAGATFDFVTTAGTNIKITKADLLAALGVTGTIVQDGPVTAVPVLDTQGAVHNIRNLSPGAGILIEVDPENGILISLEGTPGLSPKETAADTTQLVTDRLIYTTGDLTLTMIDPGTAGADLLIVRSITGTCTFAATLGSVETVSITAGSAVQLAPRPADSSWREV